MRVCPHAEAAADFALGAVFQFFIVTGFHQDLPNRPHCTLKVQQLSCSLAAARLGIGKQISS
jgi:hypothetical protein